MQTQLAKLAACICAAALLAPCESNAANENRYDLFAKTITPLAELLAGDGGAVSAELREVGATGSLRVDLQTPDRLRIEAGRDDLNAALWRAGQQLWVAPRELAAFGASDAKPRKETRLPDFRLPIPKEALALLPALFQIDERENQLVSGMPTRVIDVRLMPELARALKANQFALRLWIADDHKLARLAVNAPKLKIAADVLRLEFSKDLPQSTFTPPPEAVAISAGKYIEAIQRAATGSVRRDIKP